MVIEVLPDAVQGWFLLDKCGLDPLEKSVIQGDLKGQFTLAGVENSLRSHWTDDQIKKRDGEPRHHANYGEDPETMSGPEEDPEETFFEDWSEQEVAWFREARAQEMEAWVQFQQSRRTLKEAWARQAGVRLGRRFYKPGNGKGPGKGKQPIGAGPSGGPCLRCGRNHRTSECNLPKEETKGMQAEELAEYTYYNDQDHDNGKVSEPSMDKDNLLRDKFHEQLEEHEAPAALAYSGRRSTGVSMA